MAKKQEKSGKLASTAAAEEDKKVLNENDGIAGMRSGRYDEGRRSDGENIGFVME